MTSQRDLAWKHLNNLYQSSVSHQFARYALALSYGSLPPEVVHHGKRCLLDALGCAIGAFDAPGRAVCEATVKQIGGPDEATVFGSGLRTSALNATLVNSFLVRFLDYNDFSSGGHNSDAIASIIAVAEREKAKGRDLLAALIIAYELRSGFSEAAGGFKAFGEKGWTSDTSGGLCMPPALGKLMGLTEEQIVNAIGICACHSLPLGILDTDNEENSMSKNLRFGSVTYDAILACMLAKNGFTGPPRVIEGENGFNEVLLQGGLDITHMLDGGRWRILATNFKIMCLNASTIAHVLATLSLVKEHDIKPEDIASVRIITSPKDAAHTTAPPKKYPRNAESADHSAFWANAMVIKERKFGPDSFEPANFTDPVVLDLIERITVEADPGFAAEHRFRGVSEITTRDGRVFRQDIDAPHGFGSDPLTDDELEDKFRRMALKYMPGEQVQKIFDAVWNIENLDDIGKLTALMVIPARR